MSRCTLHGEDGCTCGAEATSLVTWSDAGRPNVAPACDEHATRAVVDGAREGRDVTVTRRGRS